MARVEGNIKGTNKINLDNKIFRIKELNYSKAFNSKFPQGDIGLFSATSSDVSRQDKPLKFTFLNSGAGFYNLQSVYTLNSTEDAFFFNMNFGFRFKNSSTISSDWTPFILDIQSVSSRIKLDFIYDYATGNTNMEIYLEDSVYHLGGSTNIISVGNIQDFRVKLIFYYDSLYILKFDNSNSLSFLYIAEIALNGVCTLTLRGEASSSDAPGYVELKNLEYLPVFDFKTEVASEFVSAPIVLSTDKDDYIVLANLLCPGNFYLDIFQPWPSWTSLQAAETFNLEVLSSKSKLGGEKLVISDLETLYTDAEGVLACPARGYRNQYNKGNVQAFNKCFNDGSLRDENVISMIFDKFGKFNNLSDRLSNPQFLFEDGEDILGCNFDFQRIHHYQTSSKVTSGINDHITILKSLELSSGSILYYGTVSPTAGDKDINPVIDFTWSDDQIASPMAIIDEFAWTLEYEDGTIIDGESGIHYSNYLTKLPDAVYNIPCPRARFILYQNFGAEGSGVSGEVLDDGALIANGYAEYNSLGQTYNPSVITTKQRGVCIINFDIKQNYGGLIAYVYDPCNNSFIKYHDAGTYVNTGTDSVSAFEDSNGDIIFVFEERNVSVQYLNDRRKILSYKKMNLKTGLAGTFDSSIYDIVLPNGILSDSYIHAFDIVKKNNSMFIYMSTTDDNIYIKETRIKNGLSQQSSRSKPFTPFGNRGLICLGVDINGWDFENKDYTIIDYSYSNIILTAVEEFCRVGQGDLFFFDGEPDDAQYWRKYAHLTRIRANYDRDNNITIISGIETNTRIPVVLMGNDTDFKEVSLPSHFDIYELTKGRGMPYKSITVGEPFLLNFSIDSFSACMGYDGMIYTIASKRQLREIGLVDPSFYWSSQNELVTSQAGQYNAKVFLPEYRFENLPFMCTGKYEYPHEDWPSSLVRPYFVDINRIKHNLITCLTSIETAKLPLIMANSCADKIPFETFREVVWTPDLVGTLDTFTGTFATYTDDEYVQLRNLSANFSVFNGLLDSNNTFRNKHWKLDVGYRFHARMKFISDSVDFTEPAYFYGSAITNVEDPFLRADGRFVIYKNTFYCEYYDGALGDWVQLGDITDLDDGVYDFEILMQRSGEIDSNKGSMAFSVKKFIHQDTLIQSSSNIYNLRNEIVFFKNKTNIQFVDNDSLEETQFGVYFTPNGSSDRNEYVRIYEMGYGLLKADIGSYIPFEDSKPSLSTFTNYAAEPRIGKRFRMFDDSILFNYLDRPLYNFRTYIHSANSLTSRYHWYNGFSFAFAGDSAFNLDKISLQREAISDINDVLSKNLYGDFFSKDTSQITIWADSADSGLDKFETDIILVTGCNFRSFQIVGRDSELDLWTVIENVNLLKYTFSADVSISSNNDVAKFYNEEINIPKGSLIEYPHYIYNASYGTSKIIESDENFVYALNFGGSLFDSVYRIYSSRIAHKLSSVQRYRYIGIRIPSQTIFDNHFKISTLEIGKITENDNPHKVDNTFQTIKNINSKVDFVYRNQALNFEDSLNYNSYTLSYSVTSAKTYLNMLTVLDRVANSNKPIWLIPDIDNDKFEFDLTFVEGDVSHETLVDDVKRNGQISKLYKISINLKGTPR